MRLLTPCSLLHSSRMSESDLDALTLYLLLLK
jgi:hypothetical protein